MPTTIVPACWTAILDALDARIAPRYRRAETRIRVRHYLAALLAPVARKDGRQLAEHLGESGPQGVRRLLNTADWDAAAVRAGCPQGRLIAFVVERLGDPDGALIVDETGFLKKGTKSVGVQRQYSGIAGRRENQPCHPEATRAFPSPLLPRREARSSTAPSPCPRHGPRTPTDERRPACPRRSRSRRRGVGAADLLPDPRTGRDDGGCAGAGGGASLVYRDGIRGGERMGGIGPVRGARMGRLAPTDPAFPTRLRRTGRHADASGGGEKQLS